MYNNTFSMTSMGTTQVEETGYSPIYKIQGQVHHLIGSLLPSENETPSFLQVYFTGGEEAKLRCNNNNSKVVKKDIVEPLQEMLHAQNSYIKSFKAAMEIVSADENSYQLVIDADKRPTNEHARRFNLPETKRSWYISKGTGAWKA